MSGNISIYRKIRRFLFSNMNKQFLVFMFFLVLSGIFWLILTLNETYEREIAIPLRVKGIPKNVVLTSSERDTVRVNVRDKGWVLMAYLYGDQLGSISIPFKTYDRGKGTGSMSASELKRTVEQHLETSTKTISIKPERYNFSYNFGEYKRVPVRWTGRVIPEQLYFVSQAVYDPDSVDVYASRDKLDSIRVIYTEQLNHVNFRDTLHVECRLSHPNDVKVVPERVKIDFHTDVLTEEKIDGVPIRCINMPAGKVLRTFPAKVRVHFITGVSRVRSIRADDITVIADYREIQQSQAEKCTLYLGTTPQGISHVTIEPRQVDYVIEEE